ncbi:MAG: serine protease [Candidatus Andersenbacteria bacterium]|nr:serine protease [Candidatus Andersenbacteria bacterium]
MDLDRTGGEQRVVRVSFGWLLSGALGVLALGWLGGVLAVQWWPARTPLPTAQNDRQFTTVQEVTITPNTAAAERVQNAQRSVVLLARRQASRLVPEATGLVVTNDGLIVTVIDDADSLLAYDHQGRELPLRLIGRDALFGVTYFRLSENVLLPFDLRTQPVPLAYELMGISRSESTFLPRTFFYPVLEVALPPELSPGGVQRVLRGPAINDDHIAGSPLLDDDGKLAGMMLNPAAGLALPIDHLAASMERVSAGQREVDPFTNFGLHLRYEFAPVTAGGERRFVAAVTGVTANSPAAAGQVAEGDLITSVNGQEIRWEEVVLKQLAAVPITLSVRRETGDVTLTLSP